MRKFLALASALLLATGVRAQPTVIPLYAVQDDVAQGGKWEAEAHVYLPKAPNGQAIVICPGGGYGGLAMGHEGSMVAKWLNERGIAGIVLRYRLPRERVTVPLDDARTALLLVRARAAEWGIDPAKVGVMGFSAGGHLAATALTLLPAGERPDFGVLFYPVITMTDPVMHGGSRANLMGRLPDQQTKERYSPELHVAADTPPMFFALSADDRGVKPRNSTMLFDVLTAARVPVEMHVYPTGGHGWGFGNTPFKYYDEMKASLGRWLEELNQPPKTE